MSKIGFKLLTLVIIFIFISFIFPRNAKAVAFSCNFQTTPPEPYTYMDKLTVTVESGSLPPGGGNYLMVIQDPQDKNAFVEVKGPLPNYTFNAPIRTRGGGGWQEKSYNIYLFTGDTNYRQFYVVGSANPNDALCNGALNVILKPVQDRCKATVISKPIDPTTNVELQVDNASPDEYKIKVEALDSTPKGAGTELDKILNNPSMIVSLGTFIQGRYRILVLKNDKVQCNAEGLEVGATGSGIGGRFDITSSTITSVCVKNPNDPKCSFAGGKPPVAGCGLNDSRGPAIQTAIGCIHTNPAEFTKDLLKFVIGIGGGLAFLMMLLGAFQMLTSAGNPETLNAGRERLTSAVIGLLFVIFSVLLMQIIGMDILQIPGFGK